MSGKEKGAGNSPLVLLIGDWQAVKDDWQRLSAEFIGHEPAEHEIAVFDGSEASEGDVAAALRSRGLFSGKKAVLYRNPPFLSPDAAKGTDGEGEPADSGALILEWLDHAAGAGQAGSMLFIHLDRADRRLSMFKKISSAARVIDRSMSGGQKGGRGIDPKVMELVNSRLSAAGRRMDGPARQLFFEKVGTSSASAIINELDKLISISDGVRTIGADLVAQLVSRHRQEELFRLTDAVKKRDLAGALESLGAILDQEVHPLAVLTTLKNMFERLLAIRLFLDSSGMSGAEASDYNRFKAGAMDRLLEWYDEEPNPLTGPKGRRPHPYALWLDVKAASDFSLQEIVWAIRRLCDLDLELKGGRAEPRLLLEAFLFSAAASGAAPPSRRAAR